MNENAIAQAAGQQAQPREHYHAEIPVEGAAVRIHAPTLDLLSALVARLKGATPSTGVSADEKQAVTAAAEAVQKAKTETKAKDTKPEKQPEGNAQGPASASAAPADKPSSASTAVAASVTYDDVKKVVNALFTIKPDHAVAALKDFGVSHATKLTTEQWADFVAAGQKRLAELKVAA